MTLQKGDRVLVNLAPFIGSTVPSRKSVPCEVLAVEGDEVEVRTEYPCRPVSLWVRKDWVELVAAESRELLCT